jgi:hypothetical protein
MVDRDELGLLRSTLFAALDVLPDCLHVENG